MGIIIVLCENALIFSVNKSSDLRQSARKLLPWSEESDLRCAIHAQLNIVAVVVVGEWIT